MKKLMLFCVSLLFVGVASLYAQVDTTGKSKDRQNAVTQPQPSGQQPSTNSRDDVKDMDLIQSSDVPADLKSTLGGTQYKGWESGKLYRSRNNDGYVLQMKNGSKTTSHRFDGSGKAIQDN